METIGRYRIVGELGRGAMGVVYHATDPSIGRSVAIKTIRIRDINDTQQRDKLRERLFREARSAGVLSHPNIVTIYDMDEADGLAYIAMAYVNGPTLEKILTSITPLSGAKMLRILRQTASGLDYAHGRGIVHRDVKPANIMTDEDGIVKITDFGIAKITAVSNMTDTRTVVGTPNYMSPEQVQALAIDGRSDQFSLAVIAYEILTGERPFHGEHLSTVVYKIVAEQPPEAQRLNSTLTPQINEVLRRGLSKKPEDRYPSCSNFVGALEMACAESRGWMTLTAGTSAALPTEAVKKAEPIQASPVPQSRPQSLPAPMPPAAETSERRKKPSILIPLLLSVMVVLGVGGIIVWQGGLLPGLVSYFKGQATDPPQIAASSPANPTPIEPPNEPKTDAPPAADGAPDSPVANAPHTEPVQAEPASSQVATTAAPTVGPAVLPARKPSPIAPPDSNPRDQAFTRQPRDTMGTRLQDVWVSSNPPGAKAVLDGDLSQACVTPCMIHAATGTHSLMFSQAGYENEYREIRIGDTALDIPPVTLRKPSGTLMLTTNPPGASVRVDGRLVPELTPTQLNLPPGSYTITVEKGGKMQTEKIDIQQSPVYLRIPL
jgi:serine/threonine protein kinase